MFMEVSLNQWYQTAWILMKGMDYNKRIPPKNVVLGLRYCLLQILNKHIHSFVFWYKTIDSHNIQKFHTTDHAPMRKPNFCSKLVVCECELWFCGVHGWVATSDSFGMEW